MSFPFKISENMRKTSVLFEISLIIIPIISIKYDGTIIEANPGTGEVLRRLENTQEIGPSLILKGRKGLKIYILLFLC